MNKKMHIVATGILTFAFGMFALSLDAVTLMEDTAVTALDPGGYSASSAVRLTYTSDSDVAYAGIVSGPITFVKKGAGKLTLTAKWTHTGGMTINAGTVSVPDESYLGANSALVTLDGGEVALTTGTGWSNHSILVPPGSTGAFNVASDVQVMLLFENKVTLAGGTLRLTGDGTVFAYGRPSNATYIKDGTIKVESGNLQTGSEFFALKHSAPSDWAVEVCEGTTMYADGIGRYLALPGNTILAGGVVRHNTFNGRYGNDITQHATTFAGLTLNGRITVKPAATPSRIDDYHVALAPAGSETVFDVQDGATLEIYSRLTSGLTANNYTSVRQDQGFVKTGKGELVIKGAVEAKGVVTVEEGTLTFSRRAYLGLQAKLDVWPGAVVKLEDGTLVAASSAAEAQTNPLLSTADVWLDAARIHLSDGVLVPAVRNMGRCGGAFHRFPHEQTGAPGVPTFVNGGINGKSALNFDGTQAMNLNSYTNTGNQLTVIVVYKPTAYTQSTPYSMTDLDPISSSIDSSISGDVRGSMSYEVRSGSSMAYIRAETNAQRYELNWSGNVADNGISPVILFHRRSDQGYHVGRAVYGATSDKYVEKSSGPYAYNLSIRNVALGTHLNVNGSARYASPYALLKGNIGEFIVFSRCLSNEEMQYVECYLRRKWFGATDALPSNVTLPAAVTNLVLDVPASASATYAVAGTATSVDASAKAVKSGSGTLTYASGNPDFAQMDVADGALSIAPATASSLAAIWIDPSDTSSLTLENDGGTTRVAAIANKGSAGGVFAKVPYAYEGTATLPKAPTYVSDGINSRGVLSFDWTTALSTGAYTNRNFESRACFVYGIFKRTGHDASVNYKGTGSGPFCFTKRRSDAWDNFSGTGFYWVETTANYNKVTFPNGSTATEVGFTGQANTGDAYLFSLQLNDAKYLATQRMPENGAIKICTTDFRDAAVTNPLDVDWVMLGGRVHKNGAAFVNCDVADGINGNNRMWHGQIGEFIVFDRQLTQSDEAELVRYLEKKWFGLGSGSTTPPAFLMGVSAAPSFRDGTALSMADGTTLKSAAATVALGSLSLGDGVTLTRIGGDTFKFADVTGALTFGGAATLNANSWPTNTASIFSFGSIVEPSLWTLDIAHHAKRYSIKATTSELDLLYTLPGLVIKLR